MTLIAWSPCWQNYASFPGCGERKRGYFSRESRAFLHFHEDAGDFYADVKLDSKFQRMRVTSLSEQAGFLAQVQGALAQR